MDSSREQITFYISLSIIGLALLIIITVLLWINRNRYSTVSQTPNERYESETEHLVMDESSYSLNEKVSKWQQALADNDNQSLNSHSYSVKTENDHAADIYIA